MPEISIIIPVFNEEDSIPCLAKEIEDVMEGLGKTYEVIWVNDCSTDRSLEKIIALRQERPDIVRLVDLPERKGQTHALKRGLDAARGSIAVTIDGDMQNDPGDIPLLIKKLAEGYDCVCGYRRCRQDTLLKTVLSKLANFLQRVLTGLKIHDVSCTLRAYKKECIANIPLNWEGQHRFIPLCLSLQGYLIGEIIAHHRQRAFGTSKYSHKRVFRVVADFFRVLICRGRQ